MVSSFVKQMSEKRTGQEPYSYPSFLPEGGEEGVLRGLFLELRKREIRVRRQFPGQRKESKELRLWVCKGSPQTQLCEISQML